MKVSYSIVLVPIILAGLTREGVCQVAADPFEPAATEENTDANEAGPVGHTRVLIAAPSPPQVKTWYGDKILAADAAMVATLVVAAGTKSTPQPTVKTTMPSVASARLLSVVCSGSSHPAPWMQAWPGNLRPTFRHRSSHSPASPPLLASA